nr:hypothetical protein [Tanacetum cinerariifolium]
MPKVLLIAWERFSEIKHVFIDKQYQPEEIQELMSKLLEDVRNINEELAEYINSPSWNHHTFYNNDEEHSIQYKEYLEISSNAIAPVLPTEEPECSLNMGDNHLSTIIRRNSSTFDVLKDHSEILSDFNNDDTSSDDDAFEDIEYVEASLLDSELVNLEEENEVYQEEKEIDLEDILQIQDVVLREKLLSINRLIANIEFLNDNPTPDRVLKSSSSFSIFEKSDNYLSYSDNSSPEFETFSDHTEETRSGSTTAHANNSPPEYDSFCFEIEPDHGRLTSVVMNDIFDNSTNDPLLEEVDLFFVSDNSIPPGIENIDYDSEGDIHFLKEFLSNDYLPLTKNESFNFDHHDDLSFPRPPPEPPDVEIFFNPDSGVLTTNVVKGISEHYVLMPSILPTLPTFDPLCLVYDTLLLFSSENEDKVFKPGTDMEKITKKRPKPDKNEHEIVKSVKKPDQKTFSA